ncbi:SAM-dependent methyltransferase [Vibrio sp. IRLE0018]|uniref:methyltransferase n=1 Tax=Vibrio floridensis TaxID=2908007 RepID=UPI001F338C82|nr:methyltransferase [Vibrio floridensis]MCF8778237.1 SAM-dependent methyltransferase [Vibrio floridensis]
MQNQFLLLDEWLTGQERLWRFEPFHQSLHSQLPWFETHPEMCAWLESLTQQELSHYKSDTSSLVEQLSRFIPGSKAVFAAISLAPSSTANIGLDKRLDIGIPGRKLKQIEAMGSYSLAFHYGKEWLEWCSGKGYLGRVLASQTGQRVTSFEFQSSLCESGQSEANALNLPIHFVQGDALQPTAKQYFKAEQHAVALHACGDLHVRLMQYGCEKRLAAITLAPCCYHLVQNSSYQAMSTMAKGSTLKLSRSELRIPLQQTVTGGHRVQRHRELEMTYRLGLDLLLRHECGLQEYMPVPSIKKSQLSLGFEAFCQWAAEVKGFHLPKVSFAQYEKSGVERFWRMEALSLVQQVFQRALEMWLIYDKAMYLQEQGYDVSLCEFCERDITPRNIIIHASRSKKSQ